MEYLKKVLILKKYYNEYKKKEDKVKMNTILSSIKSIHGQIVDYRLQLKDSKEDNKLEILSDLEIINYKMIHIINECTDITIGEIDDNIIRLKSVEDDNIVKSDDIIKNKIKKGIPSIILFYAEWCGHCKHLLPIWDSLDLDETKVNKVKISCVKKEEQCRNLQFLEGYPTIVFTDLKKLVMFSGERTADNIIAFINENL